MKIIFGGSSTLYRKKYWFTRPSTLKIKLEPLEYSTDLSYCEEWSKALIITVL